MVALNLILSIETRTFLKDETRAKYSSVEVVAKDGRKFNFVITDQAQCEATRRSLRMQTFLDRDKTDEVALTLRNTFAYDYHRAILGNRGSANTDRAAIEAANLQAWSKYTDPLKEFKR